VDVDRLAQIAAQLVARVRDDDPDANARWLHAETTPAERDALLYVLAAAVPDDRTWIELTQWCTGAQVDALERRRAQWREAKRRKRQAA